MVRLSETTSSVVERLFSPEQSAEASRLLEEECGDELPSFQYTNAEGLERIRFAVLKISEGDLSKLRGAIKLAKEDWRDALMAAEFGHSVTAHNKWERDLKHAI